MKMLEVRLLPRLEVQIHDSHGVLQKSKLMWKLIIQHIQQFFEIMNHHKREGNLSISNSNLNHYIINYKYSLLDHYKLPHKIRDYNLFTNEIG